MRIRTWRWSRLAGIGLGGACVLSLGAMAVSPAMAQAGPDGDVGASVARGERIVQARCSRCHATGRADASPNPKAPPFREVGKLYPVEHLAEALAEGITTGDNDMPEFKFGPRDVDAIIDYLGAMSAGR